MQSGPHVERRRPSLDAQILEHVAHLGEVGGVRGDVERVDPDVLCGEACADSALCEVVIGDLAAYLSEQRSKGFERLVTAGFGKASLHGVPLLAEACVPGSVPGLAPFLKHYDGNVMIPFAVEGTFGPMFPFSPLAMDAL